MTKNIELALAKGKIEGAKVLLSKWYEKDNHNSWVTAKMSQYDSLDYYEEVVIREAKVSEDGDILIPELTEPQLIEGNPTFTEWFNEVQVVRQAKEATDTEPSVEEITERVHQYIELTDEETSTLVNAYEPLQVVKLNLLKRGAEQAIDNLTVKNNNVEYKANETAQINMTSVVAVANYQYNLQLDKICASMLSNPNLSEEMKLFCGSLRQLYQGIYISNKIQWKNLRGKNSNVQLESIAEALFKTMTAKGEVITGKKDG